MATDALRNIRGARGYLRACASGNPTSPQYGFIAWGIDPAGNLFGSHSAQ